MATLEFDAEVAAQLEAQCGIVAETLTQRRRAVDSDVLFQSFQGPYADQFGVILGQENTDRYRLISRLRDLQEQIAQATLAAEREKQRLADLAASTQEEVSGHRVMARPISQYFPAPRPRLSANFEATERTRLVSNSPGSSTVSADPQALVAYASQVQGANTALQATLSPLYAVWLAFESSCAWVDTNDVTIFRPGGFGKYIEENNNDVMLLTSIAKAFEKAGGSGGLSVLSLTAAIVKENQNLALQALNNKNLTEDEIIELLGLLAKEPSLARAVATYANGQLRSIKEDSKGKDFAWAGRLLDVVASSEEASGELICQMGAARVIELVSIAGAQLLNLSSEEPKHFAQSLRNAFGAGVVWLDSHRALEAKKLAGDIVDRLTTPGYDTVRAGGNDAYALSFLLKSDTALPTGFLLELGDRLEAFELTFPEHQYSWRGKSTNAWGIGVLFSEEEVGGAFDPMAAYMGALGKNPQAALAFFAGDPRTHYSLDADKRQQRQQYWIERRLWSHDKFTGILAALKAAVASPTTANTETAAKLTSSVAFYLANRTQGKDFNNNEIGFPSDDEKILPGTISTQAAVDLAHILTTHMAAVDYYLNQGSPSLPILTENHVFLSAPLEDARFDGLEHAAAFIPEDLRVLMKAVLTNEDGLIALRRGLAQYHQQAFGNIAKLGREAPQYAEALDSAVRGYANLHGECMKLIGDTEIAGAKARDAWLSAGIDWSHKGLQIGSSLAGKALIPEAGPAPDILAGMALDSAANKAKEVFANSAAEAVSTQNSLAEEVRSKSQEELLITLYNSGVITDDDIWTAANGDAGKYEYAHKWFNQQWDKLGTDATAARNLASRVGKSVSPKFEDYNSFFKSSFIEFFQE